MNDVPLVKDNKINDINTSIIAIKKQLKQINETVGLIDISDAPDLSPYVKKSDIVDVVASGNMNPVTSNAVAEKFEVVDITSQVSFKSALSSTGRMKIYRCGKMVTISSVNAQVNTTIGNTALVEGLPRPTGRFTFACGNNYKISLFLITTEGVLTTGWGGQTASADLDICCTYMTTD